MINYNSKYSGVIEEVEKQGYMLVSSNRVWVSSNDVEVQKIIDSFDYVLCEQEKANKRINEQLQEYLNNLISSKYSRAEQDTFPYQRLEIEAHTKDPSSLTPTIDKIALNRGVSRDDQLSKVGAKTAYFTDLTDTAIGKSQKLKDQVKASTDLDYINSINFEV